MSEFPRGFGRPHPWCLLARHRITAALADVTVIVEAGIRSGALLAAEVARELDHEVGVLPGRVTDRSAEGSNALLRDGAHPILKTRDIIDLLGTARRVAA